MLNYLLAVDYLPVGVTPVTAVPTRISYGPIAQVRIEYADNPAEIVSCSELWKYATEQGNPNNARHVTAIHLKLPTSRLEEGIAFQNQAILNLAVDKIATAWRDRSGADSSQILAATITELLAAPIARMEEEYNRIRNQASDALERADGFLPRGVRLELPRAAGMPGLDPGLLVQKLQVKRPALTTALTLPLLKWRLQRELRRQILVDLSDFLDLYSKQTQKWLRESIDVLKRTFEAAADIYRIQLQNNEIPVAQDRLQTSADLDRLKRIQ